MKQWNSQLNREKFDLEHRVRNLITQLGYHSLEHAEESQREESQAQAGPNSDSALQARLDTALAKIEALEGAATSSFHRHQRELDLLERDVKRLSSEKTALEQRITLADSLLVYTKEEAQRMREEFDERLAIKEDIISELRSKMPLGPSNPPEAPSRSKENGLPMEIEYAHLCFDSILALTYRHGVCLCSPAQNQIYPKYSTDWNSTIKNSRQSTMFY
jgi:chromosome segregation ATPase